MVHLRVRSWHAMRGWMGCTLLEGTMMQETNWIIDVIMIEEKGA